ncbi:MAG: hypothetical protein ABIP93_11200 [Gemmatimonadaceae bacterium]
MLDQQQDAGYAPADGRSHTAAYRRPMAGGGYVDVEMDVEMLTGRGTGDATVHVRGRVILERRADRARRAGHQPPVVAEMVSDDTDDLMADLFRLASDNAALARSLMKWESARMRAG